MNLNIKNLNVCKHVQDDAPAQLQFNLYCVECFKTAGVPVLVKGICIGLAFSVLVDCIMLACYHWFRK